VRILLTNDDGIDAPGIAAMRQELAADHDVDVAAPATPQSAMGHGITLHKPLMTTRHDAGDWHGTAIAGSPADCVKLAVDALLPARPDLCVSGINHGANVGINVLYSGTVAAAIEAAFLGLPAIAVSLYQREDADNDMHRAARWAMPVIARLAGVVKPGEVASINLPALPSGEEPAGVRVCRQCLRPYTDTYEARDSPKGGRYYWNTSVFSLHDDTDDSDTAALRDGHITVTPLHFDLTAHNRLTALRTHLA
jgi:5'-nucleotidase